MSKLMWTACLALAATTASATGETHCPGNVVSLPYRIANRHQMIVSLSINHAGPYDFLFDTGTQITMIEPTLADELQLSREGEASVTSVGVKASASFARIELAELGTYAARDLKVLVYDLRHLPASGLNIRGVLGEDFLERFDILLDNTHHLLCLDNAGAMRAEIRGQHVPLLTQGSTQRSDLPDSLIVSVKLSDGMRPVRLKLDSGTNVPFLYNTPEYMALGLFRGTALRGGANGFQQAITSLPPQQMKIGSVQISGVHFVTLASAKKDTHSSDFDGLLTLGLFRRVFINHAEHFAILEPM